MMTADPHPLRSRASKPRVFIVEHDPPTATAIERQLARGGFVVGGVAASGADALTQIGRADADLILFDLDHGAPAVAVEAGRRLREQTDLPLILTTTRVDLDLADQTADLRAVTCLVKPLDERELLATVRLGLRVHQLERSLDAANARLQQSGARRTGRLPRLEPQYAAFARIGADWLWEADPDGRFIFFNTGEATPDLNLSSRIGRSRRDGAAQTPENLARLAALDEILAQRLPFRDFMYQAQIADESPTWCLISGEPVLDQSGALLGYRGTGRNVDELITTQLALQEKTRVLDAVLRSMPDAIRVLDDNNRTVSINDQFFALFVLDKEELLAAPDQLWYSFLVMAQRGEYGPGDPAELARTRYSLLQEGEFSYQRQLKHGPWFEARGVPVEGGGRLTIYRDITEQRAADEALKELNATLERRVEERTAALAESEQSFAALAAASPIGLIRTDTESRCLYVNQRWCEITGLSAEEARDAPWMRAIHPADRERFLGEWTEALQGGKLNHGEYRVQRPDGTVSWVLGQVVPIPGGSGFIGTWTDITAQRQAELQTRRTQRLEAIGTLAGGIAHDLNNALTPIMMGLDLLGEQFPSHASTIEMMRASANHGSEMLKQLLTFARGAEGRRASVQPALLIDEVERIAKGTFPKSIRLVSRVEPGVPVVQGDPTQLHQVLLNLCVNARDAMPNGGVLSLSAEPVALDESTVQKMPGSRPGQFVRLTVRDTGAGIEAGDLDQIFDPFFTTKAPDRGTGLGLSTALGIVKAHSGFLQVHSFPGRGSTFSVYLPTVEIAAPAATVPADGGRIRGRGETILVVDDEASIRLLYRVVLTRLGFTVHLATNGADALEQVDRHRSVLQAIITDVLMPNLDGVGFVRALRQRGIDLPVAAASGRLDDAQADELERMGVTARLHKPFTQGSLTTVLSQLLGRGTEVAPTSSRKPHPPTGAIHCARPG